MIYNAIVAANFLLPLKLSENAHCRDANARWWYIYRYAWEAADVELICRLSKSIACLSFNFVWTFLLKSRFQRLCLCLYLYLPKLLSLNLYMTLLSFVMLLLNYVFSPIQQAQNIDVSISEFHEKKNFENLQPA